MVDGHHISAAAADDLADAGELAGLVGEGDGEAAVSAGHYQAPGDNAA